MSLHRLLLASLRRLLHPQGPLVAAPHCNCTNCTNCTLRCDCTSRCNTLHANCTLHCMDTALCSALATIYINLRFNSAACMMRGLFAVQFFAIRFASYCDAHVIARLYSVHVKEFHILQNLPNLLHFAPDEAAFL